MNHRKRKQQENLKRPRKKVYPSPYANDPPDAKCPYCGESGKGCSYINALSRAWIRGACATKHNNQKMDEFL